ncbi:MAG: hypothetical protein ACXV8P_08950 [Methylobacter sp.]
MTDQLNYLVPEEGGSPVLDASALNLFNAHNVAIGSAITLISQPPFTNNLLTTLPEDQALAAEHATTYRNGWGFGVTNTFISGLTSISEFVLTLSNGELKATANSLDNMNPTAVGYAEKLADFRALVSAMISTCCDIDADSGSILLRMKQMHDKLDNFSDLIDDDDTRIHTAITEVKNSETIIKLEAQQRSLQDQFADVNSQIAKGASTTIGQDIAFGFEFSSEFIEGVTPGAVAGAALGVVGEADAIQQFEDKTKELSDQQSQLGQQISDLATTIAEDQADALTLTLTLIAAQTGVFNTQIKDILADTGGIVDQMTAWENSLALLSDYSRPPSANFYTNQVTAGIAYWSDLKAQLTRYSNIMAQSVTNISS